MYKNEDRNCECNKCELEGTCNYKDEYLGRILEKQRFDHLMEVCNGLELTDSEIKTLKWISGCDVDTVCSISAIIVKAKVNRWKQ